MRYLAAVLLAALAFGLAPAPAPSIDARQDTPAVPIQYRRPVLRQQLQTNLETLKERLPLPTGVTLLIAELPSGLWGYCVFDVFTGGYRIVIAEAALDHWVFARETLVHEFAHAMSTTSGRWDEHPHGAYWGIAYSQAYRALFSPEELDRLPDQPTVEPEPEDDE